MLVFFVFFFVVAENKPETTDPTMVSTATTTAIMIAESRWCSFVECFPPLNGAPSGHGISDAVEVRTNSNAVAGMVDAAGVARSWVGAPAVITGVLVMVSQWLLSLPPLPLLVCRVPTAPPTLPAPPIMALLARLPAECTRTGKRAHKRRRAHALRSLPTPLAPRRRRAPWQKQEKKNSEFDLSLVVVVVVFVLPRRRRNFARRGAGICTVHAVPTHGA